MAAHWSARSTCTLRAESGCHRYLCLLCRFVFSEQIRSARFLCSVQLPMLCFHPVEVLNRSGNWPGSRRPWPCRPSSERAKGQSVSKYAKRCKPSSRTFANTRTMQTSGTAASIEAGLAPSPKVFSLKTWFARPHPPKRDLLSLDLFAIPERTCVSIPLCLSFSKGPAFPSSFRLPFPKGICVPIPFLFVIPEGNLRLHPFLFVIPEGNLRLASSRTELQLQEKCQYSTES